MKPDSARAKTNHSKDSNQKVPEKSEHRDAAPKAEAVTVPRAEYEALLEKAKETDLFHDKCLRAHAEYENLKKRLEREKAEFFKYAKEEFVTEFIPILDSIDMASRHIEGSKDTKALQDGLGMIRLQIEKFLKGLGVERIKTVGTKFDPHMHEALEVVESADKEEDAIVEELKAGYTLNGKTIRASAVKIARHGEG